MKVLVVGTGGEVVSGISTVADQMARTLEDRGIEVVRMSAGTVRRASPSRLNLANVRAVLQDSFNAWRSTREVRADIVWYHTFGVPALPALRAVVVALAARLGGARSVVHIHAYGLEDWIATGGRRLALALRGLDLVASRIVVLYDEAAKMMRDVGVKGVEVLPNWADLPSEPTPPPAPPFVVVFVGGLVERKGVIALAEAVELLDDVQVQVRLIGGGGEDGGRTQALLRQRFSSLITKGALQLVGELSPAEVRSELRRAHALALPSSQEGTPMAVLEAMAEARPVIVSRAGNMETLVERSRAGVVLPRVDGSAVAESIRYLLESDSRMAELGRSGHRHALESSAESIRTLIDLIDAVGVGQRHLPGRRSRMSGTP